MKSTNVDFQLLITLFGYFICMSKNAIIIDTFQNSTSLPKSHIVVTSQSMKKNLGLIKTAVDIPHTSHMDHTR